MFTVLFYQPFQVVAQKVKESEITEQDSLLLVNLSLMLDLLYSVCVHLFYFFLVYDMSKRLLTYDI